MKFIKDNLRVIIAVVIALVLIVTGFILLAIGKEEEAPINKVEEEQTKEEQLAQITGVSANDAVDIVKDNFYSDNYQFKTEVTKDSLYKVIVTNIIDNSQIIYYVDPVTRDAYIDIDTN